MNYRKDKKPSKLISDSQRPKARFFKKIALIIGLTAAIAVIAGTFFNLRNQADYQKLAGKWMRPDGGYVLDIKSISSNEKIDAAYFNPAPIHISKAIASNNNGNLEIFIELQDEGYPGCTYKLHYEPLTDKLQGIYYQAAIKESFDIYFVRIK